MIAEPALQLQTLPAPQACERQTPVVLDLIRALCEGLAAEAISYCHWKSNAALDRSACGKNDLDLLVARADADRFFALIYRLGFKEFYSPSDYGAPGVANYYGYDRPSLRWVHLHVHFQLMVGNDFTKSYHLAVEKAYLASAFQQGLFRIPAPEFELIVFTIRMTLKHSTWDAILGRQGALSSSEQQELAQLSGDAHREKVYRLLAENFPSLNQALFEACLGSLQAGAGFAARVRSAQGLLRALAACSRRSRLADLWLQAGRRALAAYQNRVRRQKSRMRPAKGGLLIAFVGGDGAGKTTAVAETQAWLAKYVSAPRVHLGKPDWSGLTILIRGGLKVGTLLRLYPFVNLSCDQMLDLDHLAFPGYPWLLREVCTARDRFLTYRQARKLASNGGLALCDRFPLPEIRLMDGLYPIDQFPRLFPDKFWVKPLLALARRYYQAIASPDLLLVLRVHPDTAVQRKTDEAPAYVQARTEEIWGLPFVAPQAIVIDANQDIQTVQAAIRDAIWAAI